MSVLSHIQPLTPTGITINTVSVAGQTPTFGFGNTVLYDSAQFPSATFPAPAGSGNGTTVSFDLYIHYSDFTTTGQDSAFYHVTGTFIAQYDGTGTLASNSVTLLSSTGSLVGSEPGVLVNPNGGAYRLTAGSNISISNFFISITGHEFIFSTVSP